MSRRVRLSDLPRCRRCKRGPQGLCGCGMHYGSGDGGPLVCSRCGVNEVHWTSPQGVCDPCHDLARVASVARARRRLKFGA